MKQFKKKLGSEFRKVSDGEGGNVCLGCGCLVKDISIRFAVYMVNGCGRKLFGNGDLGDVCVWDTYCWGEPLCGLVEQSSSSNP